MCRFLLCQGDQPVELAKILADFAEMARNSVRWQGDGWGFVYRNEKDKFIIHKSLQPIWEDDQKFVAAQRSSFVLVHARGAFGAESIQLANNHPFYAEGWFFVFNGNLKGVSLDVPGATGAQKIFQLLLRELREHAPETAIRRLVELLQAGSRYIVALNFILTNGEKSYIYCSFGENEDSEYFSVRYADQDSALLVCSEPLPDISFKKMQNRQLLVG